MKATRPLFLLSNDDGVTAKGINFLIEVLHPIADLFVMAPDSPRSGAGCSLTSLHPVTYKVLRKEKGLTVCSCSGTPSDCVKLALSQVMKREPDLVIGGINHGDNSSINVHYSGTMGVAFEGALHGIPSMAFSLCDHDADADFEPLRPYIANFATKVLAFALPPKVCLNVNFPKAEKFKGVKVCRMGDAMWEGEFVARRHPRGPKYFWLAGELQNREHAQDTDRWALENGYVAVTPTAVDVTAYQLMDSLREML